jgi:hypothetical protein
MIKVGLCGWVEEREGNTLSPQSGPTTWTPEFSNVPIVPSQGTPWHNDTISKSSNSLTNPYIDPDASPSQSLTEGRSQNQDYSLINLSSLPTPISPSTSSNIASPFVSISIPTTPPASNLALTKVCPITLDLVQKAIAVVRRRRSVKAIETYEQVKFLVEFVDFLRSGRLKEGANY